MKTIFCLGLALCAYALHAETSDHNLDFFRDLVETQSYTLGRPVRPQLTPDGRTVYFLRGGARDPVLRLYQHDVETGTERELLTPESLLGEAQEELSDAEKARRERARLRLRGFTNFQLSRDGHRILVSLSGKLYLLQNLLDYQTPPRVISLPGVGWIDPQLSPDGTAVAAVRDGELHLIELASLTIHTLTSGASETLTHGEAEFVAQEEMGRSHGFWWSPDSHFLVYQKTDLSTVETRFIADLLHPEMPPLRFHYPKAGSPNAKVSLGVISRNGGETTWIKWDATRYPYLARVIWSELNAPLCLLVQDRAQQNQLLYAADLATGATQELIHETDAAWLNLDDNAVTPKWLADGKHFLWTTESGGAWQVQLRRADGALAQTITPPEFVYKGIISVDSTQNHVYLRGGLDPVDTQLWRFPLDGTSGQALTTEAGAHSAVFARHSQTMIHSFDLANGQQSTVIAKTDGTSLGVLTSHAETPPHWPRVELTRTGGTHDFYAAIVRPRNFQPTQHYPVILSVYAGPTTTVVAPTVRAYLQDQWTADQGYIVVRIDGRGTPLRGRAWERIVRGNLIDTALNDQIEGLQLLAARYPEFDLTRVGVTGWSFGGYFSAMATIRRPDIFRCGIAGAPVVTWENYDTYYTERYLGLPQDEPAAYAVSNVLTYATQLERPLLLIHGLTDDNVYFQHTLQLADALYLAGKPYELLAQTGTHMVNDPKIRLRQQQRMMDFFARHLRAER